MFPSLRLGKAFNIPVFVHWSFWLAPLYFLLVQPGEGLAALLFSLALFFALFACVLLHEFGHALMARFFHIGTRDITLYPIGGVARLESTGATPFQEVCIALAGPAVNLLIALLLAPIALPALLLGAAGSGILAFLATLCLGNVVLLIFNLLPIFPMDGGRVLRALLAANYGQLRGTEIAGTVALWLAGALAIGGVLLGNLSLILIPLFIAFAGQAELAGLRQQARMERFAQEVHEEPVVFASPTHSPLHSFTGLVWDQNNRVWVRWVDGRPVDVC